MLIETGIRTYPAPSRRGVTLVEMLVTVAILVLMMTVIVQIFQAATGALNSAQVFQELDNQLRGLDATIRGDLRGVTARMTPPLNPKDGLGYFEYGENAFADIQGEDSDDYVRFTAKAPAGKPFLGRFFQPLPAGFDWATMTLDQKNLYLNSQPVTITSEFAEIIYWVRNGNLYRRVLLIAPERQAATSALVHQVQHIANDLTTVISVTPGVFGGLATSWQGANDVSARPAGTGSYGPNEILLNSLGDLTNRENRFASPRFATDFYDTSGKLNPDAVADDLNLDGVPDFYPTLYFNNPWIAAPRANNMAKGSFVTQAFPFVFPGAYAKPENDSATANLGWIHSPIPDQLTVPYATKPLLYLQRLNHSPLDLGDNLHRPDTADQLQDWWGFPTWRETLSPAWSDPYYQVNLHQGQPRGLTPRPASAGVPGPGTALQVTDDADLLPPLKGSDANGLPVRAVDGLYSMGFGSSSAIIGNANRLRLWEKAWEDELIMTGVRSFDIKAYDDLYGGFADLGWADDSRLSGSTPCLSANPATLTSPFTGGGTLLTLQTLAHEGRMPPLVADNRYDAQFGQQFYSHVPSYSGNIGDDSATIVRLRRVWDTWSTDYSIAPSHSVDNATGDVWGPPNTPPIYPSYPPPYPAPLKGIQIQIRVVDPSNQRVKQLTIRHDFTDRL